MAAVPRSVRCHKLPNFLIRNFDPVRYEYDVKAGRPIDDSGECSPNELSSYREVYANFVERSGGARLANTTRKSVVMSSLDTAANFPQSALGIVGHLFDQIEAVTARAAELDLRGADTDESDDDGEEDEDEDEDPVDNMSFKELLEEIEKLTALPVDEGDDVAGIPSTSHSNPATYDCPELGSPSHQTKLKQKRRDRTGLP